jgi:hydrogenase/urease accessory protein HupE
VIGKQGSLRPLLCAALLAAAVRAVPLRAHALSVSYARFTIANRGIDGVIRLPLDDVDLLLRLDRDLDGKVSGSELEAARSVLQSYLGKHLRVDIDGAAAAPAITRLATWRDPNGFEYLEISCAAVSDRPIRRLSIRTDFLTELYPSHKTLGQLQFAGRTDEFVFERGRTFEARIGIAARVWRTAGSFLRLGIEHIFTGYDHILFLFGLLLVGNGLKNLIAVVTSFTVAHSVTLGVATLGLIRPVPWTVEAAIALSIAYIGIENLFVNAPKYRWKVSFAFGLVHGFGFAAVLRDMHLPRSGLAASLFSFNLGVEIGQVAIVGAMYPVLLLLARTPYRVPVTRLASAIIAAVGLFWFYQRIP